MQMQIIIEKFLRSEKSRQTKLKPLEKLLMFFLSSYMGKKNDCYPSYPKLMEDLGINDKTALSNALKNLSSKQILFIKKMKGKSHHYSFNIDFLLVGNPYDPSRESLRVVVGNPYANNKTNNKINNKEIFVKKEQKTFADQSSQSNCFKQIGNIIKTRMPEDLRKKLNLKEKHV